MEKKRCSFLGSWSSALLHSGLCHCPTETDSPIFTSAKSTSLDKLLRDFLTSCKIPAHWTPQPLGLSLLLTGTGVLIAVLGPCCPMPGSPGQAELNKKGSSGLLPHLVKGLISSAFCEETYTAGCRVQSIKAGAAGAASPQCPAHISADAHTVLLLLLPRLIRGFLGIMAPPLPFRYTKRFLHWFRWGRIKLEKANPMNTILFI